MKTSELKEFDVAEVLTNEETLRHYLAMVFEDGDPREIQKALGTVARVRGISQVARDAGLSEDGLYAALGGDANLDFNTVLVVVRALGFKLVAAPLN